MEDENACADCGSTVIEVEDDGLSYCENGHIQNRGLQVGQDEQDFLIRGNVVRKKIEKEKQQVSRVLRGRKAYQLFLQAWQYILWKQCYSLVHDRGFPADLWNVVRELWALRISHLAPRLENDTEAAPQVQGDDPGLHPTSSESDPDRTDTEQELDASASKKTPLSMKSPVLVETLALNYLGMILLRQPVSLSTLFRWAQDETIPFIRAIRYVPAPMKARLPGEYHRALDTITVLTPDELQLSVFGIVAMFGACFGMGVPQLNFKPLLLTYVEKLALPLETYLTVKRLNTITNFKFTHLSPRTSRRSPMAFPEAQLMSLVVIATKLLYPFDSDAIQRHPRSLNDPGAINLNWTMWLESRRQRNTQTSTPMTPESSTTTVPRSSELMSLTDTDIISMTGTQLDQYMDWYQRTWTKPQPERVDVSREILDEFPLVPLQEPEETTKTRLAQDNERQQQKQTTARLIQVHSKLKTNSPIPDPSTSETDNETDAEADPVVIRPGARYTRFPTLSSLAEVAAAQVFHQDAADAACLSLETLLRAVNHTEQQITIWKRAKRRAEVWGEEMDLEAETGVGGSAATIAAAAAADRE